MQPCIPVAPDNERTRRHVFLFFLRGCKDPITQPKSSCDWLELKSIIYQSSWDSQCHGNQCPATKTHPCVYAGQPQANMPPKKKTKKTTKKNPERSITLRVKWLPRLSVSKHVAFIFFNNMHNVVAGENDLEAKYRRSVLDVAILQDHIGELIYVINKTQCIKKTTYRYLCFLYVLYITFR